MLEYGPEKPATPTEQSEKLTPFLDKPMSRRDFLKVTGAAATAVAGVYGFTDWRDFEKEELDQYKVHERMGQTIDLMESLDLKLSEDKLYGFTFPTTREMAGKFNEALKKEIGNPSVSSLIVVQERAPRTIIGRIAHAGRGITAPRVRRAQSSEFPSFLNLPDYSEKHSAPETIPYLYHEGLHLFYQELSKNSSQNIFDDENIANVAEILLGRLLQSLNYRLSGFEGRAVEAYEQAVSQKDRKVWEEYLKSLYKLPQDCCVYQPANTHENTK